eukprot:SAG31_NODE_7140_length_1779_cov_0.745238_1_plen_132_part_00
MRASDFTSRGFFSERSLRSVVPGSGNSAAWKSDLAVSSTSVHYATARRASRKAPKPVKEDFLFPQTPRVPMSETPSNVDGTQSVLRDLVCMHEHGFLAPASQLQAQCTTFRAKQVGLFDSLNWHMSSVCSL